MAQTIMKYNPAFLKPEELVATFAVRHRELDTIVRIIRENVTKSNQHILVIGPRGIGKTMLVLRVVEAVKKDDQLNKKWYPLVFSEESYQVSTCGEFWLEALFHLSQQPENECWQRTYEELKDEKNEKRLREKAIAQLMDFADEQGKRILLVVENFNMLLGDQLSSEDAWAMRHTLLNEPRIMLLASATSRFEEVDVEGKPMFDLFRFVQLRSLDEDECRVLWASVTGQELNNKRVRPLEILTGGNPRLLAIVSNFATRMSLKELMSDLLHLVDEHTEYFKSHLDKLPAVERKVYLTLVELYAPATARRVAKAARLEVSKTSALLGRLIGRGAVVEANGGAKAKYYQIAERMYNIYYLMRKRGIASERVKALVHFMVGFYEPTELVGLTQHIAEEACVIEPAFREDHFIFYEAIMSSIHTSSYREELINATPPDFFEMPDTPVSTKKLLGKKVSALLRKGHELERKGELKKAEQIYREASEAEPKYANPWIYLGLLLAEKMGKYDEAEDAFRKAIAIRPDYDEAYDQLGMFLFEHVHKNEEAEKHVRKAIELAPENSCRYLIHLGNILRVQNNRYEEAEDAYRKAIKLNPKSHLAWEQIGWLLHNKTKRYSEAEQAYRKAIDLKSDCASVWVKIGRLLHEELSRSEEAEKAFRKAIEINPKMAWAYFDLGRVLSSLERYNEAEGAFRKVIEFEPKNAQAWAYLGRLLDTDLGRPDEAEKAFRKAIEIDTAYPCSWFYLGELLQKRGNYEEAERAYRTTIEKGLDCSYTNYVWANLIRLLLEKIGRLTDALKLAEKYFVEHPKNSFMRNEIAKTFYKYGPSDLLTKAEIWAEEALLMEPDKAGYCHTLASILCALGKDDKALEFARKYLEDVEIVKKSIDDAVNLFSGFAARGFAKEALEVLKKSKSAAVLEPLVVGLQLYLGEDVKAAAEIMEVAKDVVKRIEETKKQIESAKKSEEKK